MNPEVMLAKYKEASIRSDETIEALQKSLQLQDTVITMLHAEIARQERVINELRAAL